MVEMDKSMNGSASKLAGSVGDLVASLLLCKLDVDDHIRQ